MPGPLVIPLIMAGAQAAQAAIGGHVSRRNTDRTIDANRQASEYAYSQDVAMMDRQNLYNRQMWEMQNEYNSPQSQMQRLKDAGLNPALVYGHGTVANNAQAPARAEMAKYNAPTAQYNYKPQVDLPSMIGMYQDVQMRQAQIDNVKSQTENTETRTQNERIRTWLLDLQGRSGEFDLGYRKEVAPYQAETARAQVDILGLSNRKMIQELMNLEGTHLLQKLEQDRIRKQMTTMDLEQESIKARNVYQLFQNQLMQMGINSSDHPAMRFIIRMLNEMGWNPIGK